MRRVISTAAMLLAISIAAGQTPREGVKEIMQLQHSTGFATNFLKAASDSICEENFCISPASAMWALAIGANGAEGKTAKEIYNALGYPGAYKEREAFNSMLRVTAESMKEENDKEIEVNIAGSVWIDHSIDVKEEFKSSSAEYYNAAVRSVELSSAADEINRWCSHETNGRIESIVEHMPTTSQMAIVNAVWFKGMWRRPFIKENTRKKTFRKADGEVVMVDMMKQACFATYYEDEYMQATARDLSSGEYSMLFILPREGVSTDSVAWRLAKIYDNGFAKGEKYMFEFEVPKFGFSFGINITPILKGMGIERAFTEKADFGGISKSRLSIDNVIQKNYISIDEAGVEAAGATAVIRCGFIPPPPEKRMHMILNRPFIFAIRENASGTILFMGKVGDPNK